jgi:hypothetical protein
MQAKKLALNNIVKFILNYNYVILNQQFINNFKIMSSKFLRVILEFSMKSFVEFYLF